MAVNDVVFKDGKYYRVASIHDGEEGLIPVELAGYYCPECNNPYFIGDISYDKKDFKIICEVCGATVIDSRDYVLKGNS